MIGSKMKRMASHRKLILDLYKHSQHGLSRVDMLLVTLGHTPGQFAAEVGRSMVLSYISGARAHKGHSSVLRLPGPLTL